MQNQRSSAPARAVVGRGEEDVGVAGVPDAGRELGNVALGRLHVADVHVALGKLAADLVGVAIVELGDAGAAGDEDVIASEVEGDIVDLRAVVSMHLAQAT